MSFIRKTPTLSSPTLIKRVSTHNTAVTLFETSSSSAITRRSNRLQAASSTGLRQSSTEDNLVEKTDRDIEDILTTTMSEGNAKATPSSSTGRKRKEAATPSTSPRKGKAIRLALETPHPAPEKWKETYAAIKDMRKEGGAPVDDMGCHMAGGPVSDPKTKRFVTLISLMLSSQTKDEVTHTAVVNLRTSLGELTVDNVLTAEEATISAAIAKVGFWRRKTQYIKQAAQKILDEFNGEIPNTVEGLCSLPGVGPKMAFLALQVAWNINVGIGVDVHVHRITNRLGWHKPSTKEPEQTRLNLQSWLPTDLHSEINPLLVGFGQTICLPVGPRCNACTLSVKNLCPSAKTDVKSKSRRAAPKVALPRVKVEIEEAVVDSDSKTTVQETVKVEERTVNSVTELDEGVKEET